MELDVLFLRWMRAQEPHALLTVAMVALTLLGSGWSLLGMLPLLCSRRLRPGVAALIATLLATSLLVFVMKHAVGRVRPCNAGLGIEALVFSAPSDPSFPSGHASGAFAFAAFVAAALRAGTPARAGAALALLGLATGVGVSRIYLGVHYPSDILGAAVVGVATGTAGALVFRRRSAARS